MMNKIFSPHTGLTSQRKDMCEGGVHCCWWTWSHTPFIVLLHFGTNTMTCLTTCLSISGLLGFDGQLSLVLPGRAERQWLSSMSSLFFPWKRSHALWTTLPTLASSCKDWRRKHFPLFSGTLSLPFSLSICCFPHCSDGVPDRHNLREAGLYWNCSSLLGRSNSYRDAISGEIAHILMDPDLSGRLSLKTHCHKRQGHSLQGSTTSQNSRTN